MQKNDTEIFETIFETQNVVKTSRSVLSIRHREFNIIQRDADDTICLSLSSTFSGKVEIYQRRIIKIVKH